MTPFVDVPSVVLVSDTFDVRLFQVKATINFICICVEEAGGGQDTVFGFDVENVCLSVGLHTKVTTYIQL